VKPRPATPDMLGERWGCSAETVRQMVKRGELRGFRVGRMIRIPWDAVEELEACKTSPTTVSGSGSATPTPALANGSGVTLRHARQKLERS
jgi:excisionase family DNA binding protein